MASPTRRALALGLLVIGTTACAASGQTPPVRRLPAMSVLTQSGSATGTAVRSAVATGEVSNSARGVDVAASLGRIRLAQEGTVREMTLASAATDSLFASPAVSLDLGASGWSEGGRDVGFGGFVIGEVRVSSHITLTGSLTHDPIWRASQGVDPLRGLRVRDLRQLGRGLKASEARFTARLGSSDARTVHVEAGGTLYSDDNQRAFLSAAARWPLKREGILRLVIEPGAYAESFARSTPGFLTPVGYVRVGWGLRAVSHAGPLAVEGVLDPHVFRDERGAGLGLSGTVSAALSVGDGVIELTADFMRQGSYRFVQTGFRVTAR